MVLIHFDKLTSQGRSTVGDSPSLIRISLLDIRLIERIGVRTSLDYDRISVSLGHKAYLQLLEERRVSTVSHLKAWEFLMARGSEDYRWVYVRKLVSAYLPPALQQASLVIFNLTFISFIQNILLFLKTSPYIRV